MDSDTFVVLDTEVTEELEAEGYVRDAIRAVQDARSPFQSNARASDLSGRPTGSNRLRGGMVWRLITYTTWRCA